MWILRISEPNCAEELMLLNCGVGEDSLRVPWTAMRSNQFILKEISPGCSLEGMMLMLKLQYFGHLMQRVDSLEKTDAGRDRGQEEKGTTEDEMAGWHHQLHGCESERTPGVGDGQGGLVCCDSWGCKESNTTELIYIYIFLFQHVNWLRNIWPFRMDLLKNVRLLLTKWLCITLLSEDNYSDHKGES